MTTDERLTRVESQLARARSLNGFLVACMILCLALCIFLCLGGWFIHKTFTAEVARTRSDGRKLSTRETALTKSTTKEIRANSFVVVDEDGKTRATLNASEGAGGLRLFDKNGNVCFGLVGDGNGPFLSFGDENGNIRLLLGKVKDVFRLSLLDENHKERAGLWLDKNMPMLLLRGENERSSATLFVGKTGTSLSMRGENESPRAELTAGEDGTVLRLRDENGKGRAVTAVMKNTPLLGLFDENGKLIWSAPGLGGDVVQTGPSESSDRDLEERLSRIEGKVLVLETKLRVQ